MLQKSEQYAIINDSIITFLIYAINNKRENVSYNIPTRLNALINDTECAFINRLKKCRLLIHYTVIFITRYSFFALNFKGKTSNNKLDII